MKKTTTHFNNFTIKKCSMLYIHMHIIHKVSRFNRGFVGIIGRRGGDGRNVLICMSNISTLNYYYYTFCQFILYRKIGVFSMIENNFQSEIMTMIIVYV